MTSDGPGLDSDSTRVQIGNRTVGSGLPCFVLAEIGVNHDGRPDQAHRLIDMAADLGADAVKFQAFAPASLVAAVTPAAPYQRRHGATSQIELLSALRLPEAAWPELAVHARERGLAFVVTPFDEESLALVLQLEPDALKIASGDITNHPLITSVAAAGIPVILSTGMCRLAEVEAAVEVAANAGGLCLLHCVSSYPARIEEANLRCIPSLWQRFSRPIGWSDHTLGCDSAIAAVALGASILEKHITLDRHLAGPDHAASEDAESFRLYVTTIRRIEEGLGDGVKRPTPSELENCHLVRRSYHAARDLRRGHLITLEDIKILRPAAGLPPTVDIIGRRLKESVLAGAPIRKVDLVE